jgi:hypothetical protein
MTNTELRKRMTHIDGLCADLENAISGLRVDLNAAERNAEVTVSTSHLNDDYFWITVETRITQVF